MSVYVTVAMVMYYNIGGSLFMGHVIGVMTGDRGDVITLVRDSYRDSVCHCFYHNPL